MDYINKIEEINKYLELNLSEKRYNHSVLVAKMSSLIAGNTGHCTKKAYLAGLSHDIAREFKKSDLLISLDKKILFSDNFFNLPQLFHGPVGSSFLKKHFEIIDTDILESVMFHSMGYVGMCDIAKIVYVADYISMDRIHIDNSFRGEILKLNLNQMVIQVIEETIKYLSSIGETILPETDNMYNEIMRVLSEEKTGV